MLRKGVLNVQMLTVVIVNAVSKYFSSPNFAVLTRWRFAGMIARGKFVTQNNFNYVDSN